MRNISFMLTERQILDRTKTVTRRKGWKSLTPGTLLQPINKCQGLRRGESPRKIGGPIRVVSVRLEKLSEITQEDVVLEGFPGLTPQEFVKQVCADIKCEPDTIMTRIEFEFA